MSSAAPVDLTASSVIERIRSGDYPPEVVGTIAAGFLPLPHEELIAVLAYIATQSEPGLASVARSSLADIPARSVLAFAADENATPEFLAWLAGAADDAAILETLIRNRAMSDQMVAQLAAAADAAVQEVIVINQARILRSPQILDALLANPRLTPDTRRRALETREEFFDKQQRTAADTLAELVLPIDEYDRVADDLPVDAIADLLEKAAAEDEVGVKSAPPELSDAEKKAIAKLPIFARLPFMTISERVQLAFRGGRTERMLLVRDRNRLVCSAVMRNPRMTDTEAEAIAGMRNVEEEVLRLLTMRREFMAKYSVVNILVHNPKAPVGVVLPLINRLTLRDLKGLKDDRNVPEVIRATARKLYQQRQQKA